MEAGALTRKPRPTLSQQVPLGGSGPASVRSQVSTRRVATQWWVPRATQPAARGRSAGHIRPTWTSCLLYSLRSPVLLGVGPSASSHTLIETREKQEPSWLEPSPLSPPCESPDPSLQVQATGEHRLRRQQLFFTVKGKLRPSPPCGDSAATAGGSQDAA